MRPWLLMLAGLVSTPAWADAIVAPTSPFAECDQAIGAAAKSASGTVGRANRVPDKLLPSIARVESGRLDAASGKVRPWPWTINVDGVGYFFDSKPEVIAAVQALQAKGKRSIDVGCMQVNLMHHPKAFADLEEAFDPGTNARYAVKFLTGLYQQTRDWPLATAWYHSSTPEFGEEYQRLVFGRVMTPMGATGTTGGVKANGPYGVWPPAGTRFGAIPPMNFSFGAFAPATAAPAMFGGVPMLSIGAPASFTTAPSTPPRKK
jgi:hypothetical protein